MKTIATIIAYTMVEEHCLSRMISGLKAKYLSSTRRAHSISKITNIPTAIQFTCRKTNEIDSVITRTKNELFGSQIERHCSKHRDLNGATMCDPAMHAPQGIIPGI